MVHFLIDSLQEVASEDILQQLGVVAANVVVVAFEASIVQLTFGVLQLDLASLYLVRVGADVGSVLGNLDAEIP